MNTTYPRMLQVYGSFGVGKSTICALKLRVCETVESGLLTKWCTELKTVAGFESESRTALEVFDGIDTLVQALLPLQGAHDMLTSERYCSVHPALIKPPKKGCEPHGTSM